MKSGYTARLADRKNSNYRYSNGYIRWAVAAPARISFDRYVMDTLLPDLVGHDRRPSAFLVYLAIATEAADGRVALSHAQLAERTGLSRRSVQDAVAHLARRELIELIRHGLTDILEYRPLAPWRRGGTPAA